MSLSSSFRLSSITPSYRAVAKPLRFSAVSYRPSRRATTDEQRYSEVRQGAPKTIQQLNFEQYNSTPSFRLLRTRLPFLALLALLPLLPPSSLPNSLPLPPLTTAHSRSPRPANPIKNGLQLPIEAESSTVRLEAVLGSEDPLAASCVCVFFVGSSIVRSWVVGEGREEEKG
jgi:hypothetical protein